MNKKTATVDAIGKRLSTATILFHSAVADRLGLGPTEAKCRTLLAQRPMTAGELASVTGLTTGAITGVIDRLEAAGAARRTSDPSDRRKVIVEGIADARRDREAASLFAPMGRAIRRLASRYSEAELDIVLEFLESASEILERETRKLRRRD
jgi:DNA-binding MarR family transcriptional regulator